MKVTELLNCIGLWTGEQTYEIELKKNNWLSSIICILEVLLYEGDKENEVEKHIVMHISYAFEIAIKAGDMDDPLRIELMNEVLEMYGLKKLE
jgi:hypothetical protein